jgi:hypothetical protein
MARADWAPAIAPDAAQQPRPRPVAHPLLALVARAQASQAAFAAADAHAALNPSAPLPPLATSAAAARLASVAQAGLAVLAEVALVHPARPDTLLVSPDAVARALAAQEPAEAPSKELAALLLARASVLSALPAPEGALVASLLQRLAGTQSK